MQSPYALIFNGVDILLNTTLQGVTRREDEQGFHLDLVQSESAHAEHPHRIYGWRGEYRLLDEASTQTLNTAVYPVPPSDGSGLGVHITPTVNGGILLGPSAEYVQDSMDTANTAAVLAQLQQEALTLVPSLEGIATIKTYSGVRPKLFGPNQGVKFRDFIIEEAKYVRDTFVANSFELKERHNWSVKRTPIPRTRYLSTDELQKLWNSNPEYGRTVCYCELVSSAEIWQALDNPLGCRSIHAIRKRTHATLGICQGGYCLGKIQALMGESVHKTRHSGWYFTRAIGE